MDQQSYASYVQSLHEELEKIHLVAHKASKLGNSIKSATMTFMPKSGCCQLVMVLGCTTQQSVSVCGQNLLRSGSVLI
ncbi:hypothetical protein DPMN_047676 [Dreissena polymorpha]|uniref:Uncharacterized protein n=1 Tax=Dreissena polymorpha TaxID=45954 RepID=A0A9D4DBW0_DREPO|nr:hypothetical protein DPMN_047676 [Dreissena polymorpha]